MSDILEKFSVFSEISEKLKQNIKLFDVTNDFDFIQHEGKIVFFVTNDDKFFAFGSNYLGQCGFGHSMKVDTPQEIPELNGKGIKQFFIGWDFVLALNENNHVFGWGNNYCGQLGRGYTSGKKDYLKPELIPDLENIIEISCGEYHSLALDEQNNVFSWGLNASGQVGCGKESGNRITRPVQLKELPKIKSIHCCGFSSFAVTFDGLVYSWGLNGDHCLGHKSREKDIFKPELINGLNNVRSVDSYENTYFLTNEGNTYFCGRINSREGSVSHEYQLIPRILKTDLKFQSIETPHSLALSEETVYRLKRNSIQKTKYKSFFDYFLNEFEITIKPLKILEKMNFSERFQEISELGSGQFGQVLKVKDTICDSICALKRIDLSQNDESLENRRESLLKDFLKEVNIMSKCKSEYVVKYFGSKVENNFFYILMELFDSNLDKIIKEKNNCFERQSAEVMTITEYFICSQLMKELLECAQYLHQLDPPIIHRDLKPQNILVNYQPKNNRFLKICDFGISTYGSDITKSHTRGAGTKNYMAPEVMAGIKKRSKYSTKADVYSLAIIIHDLFDFEFFSPKQINSSNKVLKQKWMYLEKLIDDDQMLSPDYRTRPTCAQILENSEMWSISKTELQFVDKDLIKECENQFIKTYFEFKINETTNSNDNE